MRRRNFLALIGGATILRPLLTAAQSRVAHVAVLTPYSNPLAAQGWSAFIETLSERGWIEGRNVAFEVRYTEGRPELFRRFAAELVALRPDVIVGVSTQGTQAAREQTNTIPIVTCNVGDPLAAGFVASLARPGGNITGPSAQLDDLQEKSLQLLKEVRPGISRIAVLWTPDNAGSRHSKAVSMAAASKIGIAIEPIPINTPEDLDRALAAMAQNQPDALLVHPTPFLSLHDQPIIAFALTQRLPTLTGSSEMARNGILLSYATDWVEQWRVAAVYVHRILKGANPAELPVQQPTKFQFVVNMKTARAIGIEMPQSLLARADEVIE